jgi:hypothetical protein
MAVNFTKNQDEITRAWREVVDSANVPKWALFGYEGPTNVIKLMATGSRGLDELVEEFNCSLIQYAFCRVVDESLGLNRLVLINWQGDSAPLSKKGLCASHVGDVSNYFKGCAQTITIRNDDEATKEHLMEQILKVTASKMGLSKICTATTQVTTTTATTTTRASDNGTSAPGPTTIKTSNDTNDSRSSNSNLDTSVSSSTEPTQTTSSVYKKVDIGSDIAASRKSFWQRQEEEEKERLAEEKRRAAEKQAQFEKERKQREELEAKKLAETIRQREQLIEATKKADKSSMSSLNQPTSSTAATSTDIDDDGRVGRRSELLRLERNQETQSLISKGLIKNKRAIFEQAQQQQQQQQQPTLSRRSSGAIITKRVNAFKSLDVNVNSNTSNTNDGSTNAVGKLSDSFAKQINVNGDESAKASPTTEKDRQAAVVDTTPVKKEVEAITLTREDDSLDAPSSNSAVVSSTNESTDLDGGSKETSPISHSQPSHENGADVSSQDVNGNSENSFSKKSPTSETAPTTEIITNEDLIMNGKSSNIKAVAMFDYQAADNTEISFDPDDQIGHIQKVDSGWWHGQVISGRFKGQIGLFPANYVQEL